MAKPMFIFNPKMQFFDNSGVPLAGGKIFIYQPGTTTKMNTYTDSSLGTVNPNPIILDSAGRPANNMAPIDLYVTAAFKMVLAPATDTDPPMNALWTEDNITTLGQLVSVMTKTANYTVVTSDRDKLILVDASAGPVTITLLPVATAGNGFDIKIKKIDTTTNNVIIQANAAETLDGVNSLTTSTPYAFRELITDGTQWASTSSPVTYTNGMAVFTANGTFTVPANSSTVFVECFGGGAGGGGSTSASTTGGGGGGGAYASSSVSVTPNGTVTITVGTGGAGAALNTTATGSNGNTTSFGSSVIALGGSGGVGGVGAAGGAGGLASGSTGTLVLSGMSGATSSASLPVGIGGSSPRMGVSPAYGVIGATAPINTGTGGNGGSSALAGGAGTSGLVIVRF